MITSVTRNVLLAGAAFAGLMFSAQAASSAEQLTWSYVTAHVGNCVAGVTCVPGGVNTLARETYVRSDVNFNRASVYPDDYQPSADFGRAWTEVQAGVGDLSLPVLKAYALGANPDRGPNPTVTVNYALAVAVQGYTNSGETALVIPLNAFSGLVDYFSSPGGLGIVSAALAVTTSAILDPAVAALWWQHDGGRFAADCGTAGALALGNPASKATNIAGATQYLSVATTSCTGQANHMLDPGETFYVWSRLTVLRSGAGVTDAGHTFNVSITPEAQQDFANLLPNLSLASGRNLNIPTDAIPEPSTWAMMILGFGAAGAMLRRRTGQRQAC